MASCKMASCKSMVLFVVALMVAAMLGASTTLVRAQAPIPNRPEGYPMGPYGAPVVLEIFVDLMCPDSAAVFPTYLQVISSYKGQVQSLLHFFPLPYHTNSFFANQGAHVLGDLTGDASKVYSYSSQFFVAQQQWYNAATENLTIVEVQKSMAMWAASTGLISANDWLSGLANGTINEELRISWKYACSRGILATPSFLINGVALNADPSWTLADWQSVIDPLLAASSVQARMTPAPVTLDSDNSTCPVGEPTCEYLPGQFECCLPGESCIKNVGCRCLTESCEAPAATPATPELIKVAPVVVAVTVPTTTSSSSNANSTCPVGEPTCEYLPGQFECCLPGESCIKNVGCRCLTESCQTLQSL